MQTPKLHPDPRRDSRDLQQRSAAEPPTPLHLPVLSAASPISFSSHLGLIFQHLLLLPDNPALLLFYHPALPFTLTCQAPISLSPTRSINICLWVCLCPRLPHTSEENRGNVPSPVDPNTHSRLEVLQLQEQTDQGFGCHSRIIEGIRTVRSVNSLACQTHSVPLCRNAKTWLNGMICNAEQCYKWSQYNKNQSAPYVLFSWAKSTLSLLTPAKGKNTTMQPFYASTFYDLLIPLGGPNELSTLQELYIAELSNLPPGSRHKKHTAIKRQHKNHSSAFHHLNKEVFATGSHVNSVSSRSLTYKMQV